MQRIEERPQSDLDDRLAGLRQAEWAIEAERQEIRRELSRRKLDKILLPPDTPEDAYFLDLPIDLTGASKRLTNMLINLECKTLHDVGQLKEWQFAECPNVGATTRKELHALLQGVFPLEKLSAAQQQAMEVLRLYDNGQDLKVVGSGMKISASRASQLAAEARRISWILKGRAEFLQNQENRP